MTTILIKKKDTAGAPAPGDLTNAAGGTEIAVNTATRRIYTKDSGGNVVELGNNATSSTIADLTVTNSTTLSYGTANQVQYLNASKLLVGSANLTFDGTTLAVNAAVSFDATTQNITLGTSQTSGLLTLGGTAQTAAQTFGQSTKTHSLNIGTGATESGATKTITIGSAGVSGSTTSIRLGSSVSGATSSTIAYGTDRIITVDSSGSNSLIRSSASGVSKYSFGFNNGTGWIVYDDVNSKYRLTVVDGYNWLAIGSGATYSNWASPHTVLSLDVASAVGGSYVGGPGAYLALARGLSYTGGAYKYTNNSDFGELSYAQSGTYYWQIAPIGGASAAGTTATPVTYMTLSTGALSVTGSISATASIKAGTSVAAQGTFAGYTGAGIFISYESTYGRLEAYDYATSAYKDIGISPNGGSVGVGMTGNSTYGKLSVNGNIAQYGSTGSGNELGRFVWFNTATNYETGSIRMVIGAGQINRGEIGFYVNNGGGQVKAMYIDYAQNVDISSGGAVLSLNRGQYSQQTKFYQDTNGSGAQYETTNPSVNAQYYAHIFKGTNNVPTTVEYGRFNEFGLGIKGATPSSGSGITFPATQSASSNANTLDDYEEGTWTSNLQGSATNPTVSYSFNSGRYTKIGNMVNWVVYISVASISGGSGNAQITLPFTSISSGSGDYTPVSVWASSLNWSGTQFAPLIWAGTNYLQLTGLTDNTSYSQTPIDGTMGAGTEIRLSGTYIVS
jgi:hypothetical protein